MSQTIHTSYGCYNYYTNDQPQRSKCANLVLAEHDLEDAEVRLPVPLDPLLPVLLEALLLRVDLDQRRKTGQDVLKLQLLLLQLAGVLVHLEFQGLELHLVSALHVLDLGIVMEDHSRQLILVLLLDNVGMRQLLTYISPLRAVFFFDSRQETREFVDDLFIFCGWNGGESVGTGIMYDCAFPKARGE